MKKAMVLILLLGVTIAQAEIRFEGNKAKELYRALDITPIQTANGKMEKTMFPTRVVMGMTFYKVMCSHALSQNTYSCQIDREALGAFMYQSDFIEFYNKIKTDEITLTSDSGSKSKAKYIAGFKLSYGSSRISGRWNTLEENRQEPGIEGPLRTMNRRVWTKFSPVYKKMYEQLFDTQREITHRDPSTGRVKFYSKSMDNVTCGKFAIRKPRLTYKYKCELNVEVKTRMRGQY